MQSEYQHAEDVMDLTGEPSTCAAVMRENPAARALVTSLVQDRMQDRLQLGRKQQRSDEKRQSPLLSPGSESSASLSSGMQTPDQPFRIIVEHTRPPHLTDDYRYAQQNKWYQEETLRKKALVELRQKQFDRAMQCGGVPDAQAAQSAALEALIAAEHQLGALLSANLTVKLPMFFADETAPQSAVERVRTSKPAALDFSAAESGARSESAQSVTQLSDNGESEDEDDGHNAIPDPNKCDVCGVVQQSDAEPKLVQPCDIHNHVYTFTCNRAVCVTCSRKKHPLRHERDDEFQRGFFCRKHTKSTCYVLDGFPYGEEALAAIDALIAANEPSEGPVDGADDTDLLGASF
jgi:hypothetical protein